MKEDYKRHDISDRACELHAPHLPGRRGAWGRVAKDNRKFINAVVWILRTGASWRDKGVWGNLFNLFVQDPDFEWLMIDTS